MPQRVNLDELFARSGEDFWDQLAQDESQRTAQQAIDEHINDLRGTAKEVYLDAITPEELERRLGLKRQELMRQVDQRLQPQPSSQASISRLNRMPPNARLALTVLLLLLALLVGGVYSIYRSMPSAKPPVTAPESEVQIELKETTHDQAIIHIEIPSGIDDATIYENTRVFKRLAGPASFDFEVFHEHGTYIYFVEYFIDGRKYVTKKVRVVFGSPKEEK